MIETEALLLASIENKAALLTSTSPAHGIALYESHCRALEALAIALAAVRGTLTVARNA